MAWKPWWPRETISLFSSRILFIPVEMRILMVGHYPPHGGGVATHLDNLVRELRVRHEVHVLTYGPVKARKGEERLVHQVNVPPVYGLRGTAFAFLGARKIINLDSLYDFDIVHAHFVGTTSYAAALAKVKIQKPLVLTAHGSDLQHTASLTLGRFYVMKSLEAADRVITVSHELAKTAARLGARNINVIPNGIKNLGNKISQGSGEYITFIGALREYKSPETFIELARHFPDREFLIVGDGPLKKELERIAPDNVRFFGYRSDVGNVLSRTVLLVLPSQREGFGMVILEANSFGVPVVGRAVGGVPELIRNGKNGLLFRTFDELLDAVNVLLEPKTNRRTGVTGRGVVKSYSWTKVAFSVERIYRELVG